METTSLHNGGNTKGIEGNLSDTPKFCHECGTKYPVEWAKPAVNVAFEEWFCEQNPKKEKLSPEFFMIIAAWTCRALPRVISC